MPRYKLTIEYDGTEFSGWQRQENGPSIQQSLEEALTRLGEATPLVSGAGRTDAGVHALGQVAHVDLAREWSGWRLREAINAQLVPRAVAVLAIEAVDEQFDARRSAIMRHYRYRVLNRRAPLTIERDRLWRVKSDLDAAAMHEAARALIGRHDFSTFRDSQCQANSPIRTLTQLDVTREGERIAFSRRSAFVPASAGALDGRLAGRSRARPLEPRRSQSGAGSGRPQPLRPGRAGLRALFGAGRLSGGKAREIKLERPLINARQRLDVLDRHALVDRVHRRADEANFDHRASVLDEARIRRAAAGRQFGPAAGCLFDRPRDEVGERAARGEEGDGVGRIEGEGEARARRRRADAPLDLGAQGCRCPCVVEARVEDQPDFGRDDVGRRIADVDADDFEVGRIEIGRPGVKRGRLQRFENRRQRADRIVGELRIGDVALLAMQGQPAGERTAPAVLDRVAERGDAGRLAEQAMIEALAARARPFEQRDRAVVDRRTPPRRRPGGS